MGVAWGKERSNLVPRPFLVYFLGHFLAGSRNIRKDPGNEVGSRLGTQAHNMAKNRAYERRGFFFQSVMSLTVRVCSKP